MPQAKEQVASFTFPEGHPRHGFTGQLGRKFNFQNGVCTVPAAGKEKVGALLLRYYGAAEVGSAELAELAKLYAPAEKPDKGKGGK